MSILFPYHGVIRGSHNVPEARLFSAQALARRAHTMAGMRKRENTIFALSHISMAYHPLKMVVPSRAAETMN